MAVTISAIASCPLFNRYASKAPHVYIGSAVINFARLIRVQHAPTHTNITAASNLNLFLHVQYPITRELLHTPIKPFTTLIPPLLKLLPDKLFGLGLWLVVAI